MTEVRNELKYLDSHEWARREEDGRIVVGISDHAQDALGDVVFVELPEVGRAVSSREEVAVVESVKAASDIYAPISGTISAINERLVDEPELVNESPYDDAWFFVIEPSDVAEMDALLSADDYSALCDASDH
jgi:glycine cleavage system H protein